jgi:hypothetical protein
MQTAAADRRRQSRLPVAFYAQELVDDEPFRCFTTNLSAGGIYLERVLSPMERRSRTVQIEVPLPGTNDALWARGEVVYDRFDTIFHGMAIRFTAMARAHRRLLRTWLHDIGPTGITSGEVIRAAPGIAIHRPARRRTPRALFRVRD